mmetsp:Transcript_4580/g.6954  ORF Transcript_4580/g.6954 Transcript_4580/m.6954 type:complete len:374 (+) Transcript_4580:136-1257(+)
MNVDDDGNPPLSPPRKKRSIEESTLAPHSITLLDLPDDHVLDNIIQFIGTDALSLFCLSWTCRFWRAKFSNDELWQQVLVDLVELDRETCTRLCELSGLDCKSLAAAVVSALQPHSVVHDYTEVKEMIDPRKFGIITFMPQRLGNVLGDTERLRQACVDACRWSVGITNAKTDLGESPHSSQFLWEGPFGRAELLVSFSLPMHEFVLEGESVYLLQDRDAFVEDAISCIAADLHFIKLDADAPSHLAWMNVDARRDDDAFDHARARITTADISTVLEASSGLTLGLLYSYNTDGVGCGVNYHYRAVNAGSRARKVNPMARYAVHKSFLGERGNLHSVLWALDALNIAPNIFGENNDSLPPAEWSGWPFDLFCW